MRINGLSQQYLQNVMSNRQLSDDDSFEAALQKAYDDGDKEKLKEACTQFESLMLQFLYKQMKATVPKGGLFEESNARSIFQDMLDEQLMDECSKRGVGLADMMYKQLSAQMDRTYTVSNTAQKETQTENAEGQSSIGAEMIDEPKD